MRLFFPLDSIFFFVAPLVGEPLVEALGRIAVLSTLEHSLPVASPLFKSLMTSSGND